jgi:undecaprenyl-diphosphatase
MVQGFAVLPGISRSGSTIVTGLFLKMDPHNAARFSFLISLPAIAGAGLLEFMDLESGINGTRLVLGAVVSFLTGLLAISWMVKLTLGGRLKGFSLYLCLVSVGFLVCYTLGWGENII